MKKTKISGEVEIQASKEKVWEVLANFGDIYKSSPDVKKSYSTSEQKTGLGATRHCDLTMMKATVEEKITGWEEGKYMQIDIYERKNIPMVKGMIAEFYLRERNGKTILVGNIEYEMTGGLGNFMNDLIMKRMNTISWVGLLAGFKKHAETGENVDTKTPIDRGSVRVGVNTISAL